MADHYCVHAEGDLVHFVPDSAVRCDMVDYEEVVEPYEGTSVLELTLMRILRRFMRMAKPLRKLFAGLTGPARTCILRITSVKKIS